MGKASRSARLSEKGCGDATPEWRAQRDVAVHPRPAAPAPLLAAPRLSTTALGYLEIRWAASWTQGEVPPVTSDEQARAYERKADGIQAAAGVPDRSSPDFTRAYTAF